MRVCCKDMARLLMSDSVRVGHPFASDLAGTDLSGIYIESEDEWLQMNLCPFCGRSALVEFEDRRSER